MHTVILNRKAQRIALLLDIALNSKGLAFVMHGLGGYKEQPHIQAFADVLIEAGYSVVRFDTTNSLGESDGKYEDATVTNYYSDLEDVITWSKVQPWYRVPFVLVGHSLGGMSVALYAEKHPLEVKAVAPISLVVSGALSLQAPNYTPEKLREWEESGWLIRPSRSKPGVMKRLKWSHIADRLTYDVLLDAGKLTMPVLLIVGSKDESTPPEHQRILYDVLPGRRELHVIEGSDHSFTDSRSLEELRRIFASWIHALA